jgi:transcriptional regulator with XRE-family HTH domain
MTEEGGAPPTVAEVLGRTARALRGNRKLELVAYAAKSAGLNWGTGRIADLEAGRVSPTLPTLFALCGAFGALLGRPVSLAELFAGDGRVTLTADVTVELADLQEALKGRPIDPGPAQFMARMGLAGAVAANEQFVAAGIDPPDILVERRLYDHPLVQQVKQSMLEADYRMAKSLGLDVDHAAFVMAHRWGHSFTAERDSRGGPDANPQKRGRVSRELKSELQEAINRGDD